MVLPVRIIMFPTSSNIDLAGRNALSAAALTISPSRPHAPVGGLRDKSIRCRGRPPPTTVGGATAGQRGPETACKRRDRVCGGGIFLAPWGGEGKPQRPSRAIPHPYRTRA